MQCDQIGIFLKDLGNNFLIKVAQVFGNILDKVDYRLFQYLVTLISHKLLNKKCTLYSDG